MGVKFVFNPFTGKFDSVLAGDVEFDSVTTDTLSLRTTYTPTGLEAIGTSYWDTTNHTISTVLENGVILQHGQELHMYGKNLTGAIIPNGQPVSVVQNPGQFTAFGTVDITTPAAYAFVGLATHEIAKDDFGYVTIRGVVRDIDTSALDEGKPVYVSATGGLTKVFPTAPNYIVNIGIVEYKHLNHGRINVIPAIVSRLADLSDVNGTALSTTGQIPVWDNTNKYFDFNYNITNYLYKPGLSGGQTAYGGSAASESLTLVSTANATKGNVNIGGDGSTNTTTIESDGTVVFKGTATVYNDLPPIPLLTQRVGAANNPSLSSFLGNIFQLTFAVNDYVYFNYELTHEYKEGTDIDVHVHWSNNGVDIDNRYVNWEVEYTVTNLASAAPFTQFPATNIISSSDVLIPAGTATKCHIYSNIGTISGSGLKIGAYILGRFRRIAATGTAPTGNPFAFTCGFHVEQDTVGSRQETTK